MENTTRRAAAPAAAQIVDAAELRARVNTLTWIAERLSRDLDQLQADHASLREAYLKHVTITHAGWGAAAESAAVGRFGR